MGHVRYTQEHYSSKAYRQSAMDNFLSKTKLVPSGCVEWQGTFTSKGYGVFSFQGRKMVASRVAYMLANGIDKLEREQLVCHSCDNPPCVNPDHLWLGSNKDNMVDCVNKGRHACNVFWPKRTHCNAGHPYTEENTGKDHRGRRFCRKCKVISDALYYQRKPKVKKVNQMASVSKIAQEIWMNVHYNEWGAKQVEKFIEQSLSAPNDLLRKGVRLGLEAAAITAGNSPGNNSAASNIRALSVDEIVKGGA